MCLFKGAGVGGVYAGGGGALGFHFWWVGGLLWAGSQRGGAENVTILLCILKPQLFTLTAI